MSEEESTEQTEIMEQTDEDKEGNEMDEDEKLIYVDESYVIRGAVMEVYKILGNGFLKAVYQECPEA